MEEISLLNMGSCPAFIIHKTVVQGYGIVGVCSHTMPMLLKYP